MAIYTGNPNKPEKRVSHVLCCPTTPPLKVQALIYKALKSVGTCIRRDKIKRGQALIYKAFKRVFYERKDAFSFIYNMKLT
jgi:hypothetical protein